MTTTNPTTFRQFLTRARSGEAMALLGTKQLWIKKAELSIRAYAPPTIRYKSLAGCEWLEVENWGLVLEANVVNWNSLSARLADHFFEYYERAQSMSLSDSEKLVFARICQQVDYMAFCAAANPKRYMECTLVRKGPRPLLRSSSGTIYQLSSSLVTSLSTFSKDDYFGAEFTFSPKGVITHLESPRLLTKPEISEVDSLLPKRM